LRLEPELALALMNLYRAPNGQGCIVMRP